MIIEEICYVNKQIPHVKQLVEEKHGGISGVQKVAVNIRVVNKLIVYVFVTEKALRNFESELITPREAGLGMKDPRDNDKPGPRLWLELLAAETVCKREIEDCHPELGIEWLTFVEWDDRSITLLNC